MTFAGPWELGGNVLERNKNNKQQFIRLLNYGRPYRRQLVLSLLLMLLGTGATLYAPVLMKTFIDDHVVPRDWDQNALILLAVGFMGMYLMAAVMSWFEAMLFQKVALSVVHDIRRQVFNHLFRLPMAFLTGSRWASWCQG